MKTGRFDDRLNNTAATRSPDIREQVMTPDSPYWVPRLAPGIRLYLDDQSRRWVVKAPQQVVFLDPLSLDVLRACDGERSLVQIALCMDGLGHRPGRAWLEVVSDVVRHFEGRGILQCRLAANALALSER